MRALGQFELSLPPLELIQRLIQDEETLYIMCAQKEATASLLMDSLSLIKHTPEKSMLGTDLIDIEHDYFCLWVW